MDRVIISDETIERLEEILSLLKEIKEATSELNEIASKPLIFSLDIKD